ncbi:MAG: DNA-directed RNA polymerase subunit omega [Bacteroidota bacterium]
MDYKKIKTDTVAVTRDMNDFDKETGNIYESLVVLSKRANTIGLELKEELNKKLSEFATTSDNLEEVFENREQIEIAKFYEQLPKPTLISIHEFLNDQIYFRNPYREENPLVKGGR